MALSSLEGRVASAKPLAIRCPAPERPADVRTPPSRRCAPAAARLRLPVRALSSLVARQRNRLWCSALPGSGSFVVATRPSRAAAERILTSCGGRVPPRLWFHCRPPPSAGRKESRDMTLPFSLEGRRALITGGSKASGVRSPCCSPRPAPTSLSPPGARRTSSPSPARSPRSGARRWPFPPDMSDRSAVEALVGATTKGLGGLDILVNNAGAAPFRRCSRAPSSRDSRSTSA